LSNRAIALLVGVFTATMLLAAGCGGDDEDSLTKAEFVKNANAICTAGNEEINKGIESFIEERSPGGKRLTDAQLTEGAEEVLLPSLRKQVEAIAALGTPSEDGEQAEEIVDGAEEALEEVEDEPALAAPQTGDRNPFAEVNEMAREYGLDVCGAE
jgi:hypothetical protein